MFIMSTALSAKIIDLGPQRTKQSSQLRFEFHFNLIGQSDDGFINSPAKGPEQGFRGSLAD